jgi:Flp pilus assembly protein TadD
MTPDPPLFPPASSGLGLSDHGMPVASCLLFAAQIAQREKSMIQPEMHDDSAFTDDAQRPPLVSVLVPTRDCDAHIRECLTGLMEQSIAAKLEIIVIDQGSEQSEWAVVPDLQRKCANMIYLRTPASSGESAALDLGLRIASGKYLSVVRATDRMSREAYAVLSAALEANGSAMAAYGDTRLTTPHQSFAADGGVWPQPGETPSPSGAELPAHPLWRRQVHDTLGGFAGHGLGHFLTRLLREYPALQLRELTGLHLLPGTTPREAEPAPWRATALPVPTAAQSQELVFPAQGAALFPGENGVAVAPPPPAAAPCVEADPELAFAVIEPLCNGDDLQRALTALEQHVERFPDHAIAHNDLAAICYRMTNMERALSHYRQAVQLAPENITFRKNLADFLFVEAGEVDEAIEMYLELHRRDPDDLETLINLGIICENVGRPAEAVSFYRRGLELDPGNQQVRERLAELDAEQPPPQHAAAQEPRIKESSTDCNSAPPTPPLAVPGEAAASSQERYQRARSLVAQGDCDAALRELEQLLSADPGFAAAHNDLAVLSYQQGAKDKALAHYEKAAALAPENSTFQKNLADFYFVEGHDVDGAIAIYLDQLRKQPEDVETLMNLGRISMQLDRPQEAETFFGKAAELEPWNMTARECLTSLRD